MPIQVAVAVEGGIARRLQDGSLELVSGAAEFLQAAYAAGILVWAVDRAAVPPAVVAPGDAEEWVMTGRLPASADRALSDQAALRAALSALGVSELVRVWEAPGVPEVFATVDASAVAPADIRRLGLELGLLVS